MASTVTDTTSHLTNPVNVIYQQTLLRNAKSNCPHFAGTVPAAIMRHRGTFTAKWRKISNLAKVTTALTEPTGTATLPFRDSVTPTVTDPTAAMSKYGNYFLLTEEANLTSFNQDLDKLVEVLGINAGESLDQLQAIEEEDNSTQIFSNGAAAASVNTIISEARIREAINALDRNNAMKFTAMGTGSTNIGTQPIQPAYYAVCHPDVQYNVEAITGFVPVEKYAAYAATEPGEFGALGRVRFMSSTNTQIDTNIGAVGGTTVRETTASKADLYYTVIYGQGAFGAVGLDTSHLQEVYTAGDELPGVQLISKPQGSGGIGDPYDEYSTMAWKSFHVAKVLDTAFSRSIVSAATDISAV
jgi:N4-gp56 family major capsid protein